MTPCNYHTTNPATLCNLAPALPAISFRASPDKCHLNIHNLFAGGDSTNNTPTDSRPHAHTQKMPLTHTLCSPGFHLLARQSQSTAKRQRIIVLWRYMWKNNMKKVLNNRNAFWRWTIKLDWKVQELSVDPRLLTNVTLLLCTRVQCIYPLSLLWNEIQIFTWN